MMITRRGFFKAGILLGGAVAIEGFVIEPEKIRVEKVSVPIAGLGAGLDGFTICQITDIHHSHTVSLDYIEGVIRMANSLEPDMMALTGDYIDMDREYMGPVIRCLSDLKARHGSIAVMGNHDYFIGREYSKDVISSNSIPLLENSHTIIEYGGSRLCVAGVTDLLEDTPDAGAALAGVPADIPRVLLSHHPDYSERIDTGLRVDLILSGHTHGGQVRLPFGIAPIVPSAFGQKYSGGLVSLGRDEGTKVYVSRGIGVSMIPVRFNCPPEITLIRLTAAPPSTKV
ncbi:MAG: metallophosphoesterase [Deltaproteobacteria bacterium]